MIEIEIGVGIRVESITKHYRWNLGSRVRTGLVTSGTRRSDVRQCEVIVTS